MVSAAGGIGQSLAYLGTAALLVLFVVRVQNRCAGQAVPKRWLQRFPAALGGVPAMLGLLTGLSLCLPFLAAMAEAAQYARAWQSMAFFAAFLWEHRSIFCRRWRSAPCLDSRRRGGGVAVRAGHGGLLRVSRCHLVPCRDPAIMSDLPILSPPPTGWPHRRGAVGRTRFYWHCP